MLDPMLRYQRLKDDFFGSWNFVSDGDFAVRIVGVFAFGFLLSTALLVNIYPPLDDETGDIAFNNIAASFLFGCGSSFLGVVGFLVWLGGNVDSVNRLLRAKAIVMEVDPTEDRSSGTMGYYTTQNKKTKQDVKRDKLVAVYATEPALSRVRTYLLGALVCSVVAWTGGGSVGGEMRLAAADEEEENGIYKDTSGADNIKACKAGCLPGAGTIGLGFQR